MSVIDKVASVARIKRFADNKQVSAATRFAQYILLDELPSLILGLITVAYIVAAGTKGLRNRMLGEIKGRFPFIKDRGGVGVRAALPAKPRGARYLFLLFLLCGCAETTQIALEPGASLSDYHVFEVAQVANDTGQTFSFDIGNVFSDELQSALRTKGYEIAGQEQSQAKTLIVKCSIVSYSPGNAGKKVAAVLTPLLPGGYFFTPKDTTTVKTTLIDLQTGKIMADIVSNQSEPESLLPQTSFGYGHGISLISAEKLVLREAAWSVASKIDEKIK